MASKQLTKNQITNQINRVLGYDFLLCDSMLFEMFIQWGFELCTK